MTKNSLKWKLYLVRICNVCAWNHSREIVPKEDHLVHIKVVEVDPRASDFLTKHRGINRCEFD